MTVTRLVYNLQIRHKMRNRLDISSFKYTAAFKLCQTCSYGKVNSLMNSSCIFSFDVIMDVTWSGYNLHTRHKMRSRLDLISQVLQIPQHVNFVRLVDMEKEFQT